MDDSRIMAKRGGDERPEGGGEPARQQGRYRRFLLWVFQNNPQDPNTGELPFSQADLRRAAAALGEEVRNFPDATYYLRSRGMLPPEILEAGYTTIAIRGSGRYALVIGQDRVDVPPKTEVVEVRINAIPEIIRDILRADEQGILSAIRYLDIISLSMGVKAHHLHGHLRTTGSLGQQVEADDVWVAQQAGGSRTILPVEAKGPHERLGRHQMISTIDAVRKKMPGMPVIPLAARLEEIGLLLLVEFGFRLKAGKVTAITPRRFRRYRLVPRLPLWPGAA